MKLKEIEIDASFYALKQVQSLKIIFEIVDIQKKELQKYKSSKFEIEIISRVKNPAILAFFGFSLKISKISPKIMR